MYADRILVAGPSGAGKTTLAARITAVTGSPHTEIDALHWRAGWTTNPEFVQDVEALAASDAWVTEFQYQRVQPMLAARAELLVWLQPSRTVVLARILRRTLRRRIRGELLWGVTREAPLRTVLTDRDHIIRWSMRTYHVPADRIRAAVLVNPALRVIRVRSARDVARLLDLLARP